MIEKWDSSTAVLDVLYQTVTVVFKQSHCPFGTATETLF